MKPDTSKYFRGSYCACGSRLKYISKPGACVPCHQVKMRNKYREGKKK